MKFKFMKDFDKWGWLSLLTDQSVILFYVVKAFYYFSDNNCYVDGAKKGSFAHKFITTVLNRDFVVDGKEINKILGIKSVRGDKEILRNFNYLKASRKIINDPTLADLVVDTKLFDVHIRILHLMVARTFNPRGGRYATVNKEELYWLSRIIEGNPPNLGEFIARKMVKTISYCATSKNQYGLAYGKVVTWLIKSKRNPIPPHEEQLEEKRTKKINMAKMGFYQDLVTKN